MAGGLLGRGDSKLGNHGFSAALDVFVFPVKVPPVRSGVLRWVLFLTLQSLMLCQCLVLVDVLQVGHLILGHCLRLVGKTTQEL